VRASDADVLLGGTHSDTRTSEPQSQAGAPYGFNGCGDPGSSLVRSQREEGERQRSVTLRVRPMIPSELSVSSDSTCATAAQS
jgi:hypothetical protein